MLTGKRTALLIVLLSSALQLFAQIKVTGKVVFKEDDEPIIGAKVSVKNDDKRSTITDVDGDFTLTVPSEKNSDSIQLHRY